MRIQVITGYYLYIPANQVPYARPALCSASKMFTITFIIIIKTYNCVRCVCFHLNTTMPCGIDIKSMSIKRLYSCCRPKLANLTAVVETYLLFTHFQYIIICLLSFIFSSNSILTSLVQLPRMQIWKNVFVFIRNICD